MSSPSVIVSWMVFFYYFSSTESIQHVMEVSHLSATVQGDIMLGGLVPVHANQDGKCGDLNQERGIQRVEAMLFTLDEINHRHDLLPNITLGANILDTCGRETYALEQSLEFIRASLSNNDATGLSGLVCKDGSLPSMKTAKMVPIRGVVGSSISAVTIQVANLLRLFSIPMISYASTSARLSDKSNHPYFARTVPSDITQAKAMAALVRHFNWTYVSTVRSSGDYGDSGIDAFWKEVEKLGVCIAARQVIRANPTDDELMSIVQVLDTDFPEARVVILFTRLEHTKLFLDAVRKSNLTNRYVWIASDGWGRENVPVEENTGVANGALTLEIKANTIHAFNDYFKALKPSTNSRNPWFKDYWELLFKCTFSNETQTKFGNKTQASKIGKENNGLPHCPDQTFNELSRDHKQESKTLFVYHAVYAFAWGLHRIQQRECLPKLLSPSECADLLNRYRGDQFYHLIINDTFDDGHGNMVGFDSNGDSIGQYNIYNYVQDRHTKHFDYKLVAEFKDDVLNFTNEVTWPGSTVDIPASYCSEPCKAGQIKKYTKKDMLCCWMCETCKDYQFVENETICVDCASGEWPTESRTGCYVLDVHYMRFNSWFAIVPTCLSFVGLFCVTFIYGTFYKFHDTPIVRASGRELSYLMLSGCAICYIMSFLLLLIPTPFTCALHRFGIGLGFAVMYSSLLTKTNRISRIFESARRSAKRPPFISPKSQLVISGALIGLQVLTTSIWLVLSPPATRLDLTDRQHPVLRCQFDEKALLISLLYTMVLIVTCTVYAVKTRHIPENFNESKFIGFTMYTTCIIWLAFVPIYFGTKQSFEVQITTLSMSISLSATITLLCLFAPKLHIIYFQPEKNIRKLTMNSTVKAKASSSTSNAKLGCEISTVDYTNIPSGNNNLQVATSSAVNKVKISEVSSEVTADLIICNKAHPHDLEKEDGAALKRIYTDISCTSVEQNLYNYSPIASVSLTSPNVSPHKYHIHHSPGLSHTMTDMKSVPGNLIDVRTSSSLGATYCNLSQFPHCQINVLRGGSTRSVKERELLEELALNKSDSQIVSPNFDDSPHNEGTCYNIRTPILSNQLPQQSLKPPNFAYFNYPSSPTVSVICSDNQPQSDSSSYSTWNCQAAMSSDSPTVAQNYGLMLEECHESGECDIIPCRKGRRDSLGGSLSSSSSCIARESDSTTSASTLLKEQAGIFNPAGPDLSSSANCETQTAEDVAAIYHQRSPTMSLIALGNHRITSV